MHEAGKAATLAAPIMLTCAQRGPGAGPHLAGCPLCRVLALLWRLPFKRVAALTLMLHLVGEFYPFSNYPMYSRLDDEADLVYVRRIADGRPVPMLAAYGLNTSRAKKIYQSVVDRQVRARGARRAEATPEEMRAAAAYVLEKLAGRMSPGQRQIYPASGIELVRVALTNEGGKLRRVETPLAAIPAGAEAADGGAGADGGVRAPGGEEEAE